ncbi:MAG: hypothetical protein V9G13_12290 [Marmoricola sp.]
MLFVEGDLLRLGPWLPDAMVFAAVRAFPMLLLLLTLPPLMRRLGATRPLSWLAVVLAVFAPAAVWWSFWPVRIMAFAAAGSYLLVLARDRFERKSWPLGVLVGNYCRWLQSLGSRPFMCPGGSPSACQLAAATTRLSLV